MKLNENHRPPFAWLGEEQRIFLSRGYLVHQSPEERVDDIAAHAEKLCGLDGFASKFKYYMERGYYSLSSPLWSNYGTDRGLPVSCFGSYLGDDMSSILRTHAEVGMLSKFGGGTSGYFGALRPRGSPIQDKGESTGSVHFMELFETLTNVVSQGSVRRGFFSPYLDITHDDFDEFVVIGTEGHPIQHMKHGVCVPDGFLNKMIDGDVECRRRWAKVLQIRGETGTPYIFFTDTVNNNKPEVFKDHKIHASNMCSEIALPSTEDETFVCVLASMNLLYYDEWKDTDAVATLTIFLDTVCTEFMEKIEDMKKTRPVASEMLERVLSFTNKWRALGLGVLGWHSYLQSKMIPFESRDAARLNLEIIRHIRQSAESVSEEMASLWGEPEGLVGSGRRNATLLAIAPTKSSSFILGNVSQGIEPEQSNYYVTDLAKLKTTVKNPYLLELLKSKEKNTPKIWASIEQADGSVQHLDFLSELEKGVFKTFMELNPEAIIDQAATRQTYIDQSQSLNLMISPNMPAKELNALYLKAWKLGVKTLYYQYNISSAQELRRTKYMSSACVACEG